MAFSISPFDFSWIPHFLGPFCPRGRWSSWKSNALVHLPLLLAACIASLIHFPFITRGESPDLTRNGESNRTCSSRLAALTHADQARFLCCFVGPSPLAWNCLTRRMPRHDAIIIPRNLLSVSAMTLSYSFLRRAEVVRPVHLPSARSPRSITLHAHHLGFPIGLTSARD